MAFEAYESFANTIKLTIQGTEYELPEVNAQLGVRINLVLERANEALEVHQANEEAAAKAKKAGKKPPKPKPVPDLEDADSTISTQELLGDDLYNRMVDDKVPVTAIHMAAQVIYHDFLFGREAAEAYWNSGGDPKEIAKTLPAQNIFTMSGDAETTTQKRASTSGTKSKTKSSRSTTAGTKPSATQKSSNTGGSSKARSKQS